MCKLKKGKFKISLKNWFVGGLFFLNRANQSIMPRLHLQLFWNHVLTKNLNLRNYFFHLQKKCHFRDEHLKKLRAETEAAENEKHIKNLARAGRRHKLTWKIFIEITEFWMKLLKQMKFCDAPKPMVDSVTKLKYMLFKT